MSELKTNLEQILQEKTTKLIPENIKRKVEIFDVVGTDGDAEVEELQTKIIETRQEIADTRRDLENSAATVTGTGENVILNKTAEATFKKLGVGGNSEQESTTGRNLLPTPEVKSQTINGVTISRFEDGTITIKGTPTAQMDVKFNFEESTFSAGSYIHFRNNFSTYNFAVSFRKDGVNKIAPGLAPLNNIYQIPEDITVNQMVVLCNNDAVGTAYDITLKPSIELTNEVTEYEPYTNGASPNPDYPQTINNVTGDVEVEVQNKNLFDKNNANLINAYISNDTITANSANRIFYLKVKPNTTYAITKYKSYYFTVGCVNKIPEIGDTLTNIQSGPDNYRYDGSKGFLIYTTDATAQYIVCRFYQTSLDTGVSLNDMLGSIQVEVNSTPTDYIEHKEQTFTFPLGNEKLMLGDYLADDGIHHVRGQVVFDGSEDENWDIWQITSTNVQRFYIKDIIIPKTSSTSLCSHFKFKNDNSDVQHFRYGGVAFKEFIIYIDRAIETVEQLKVWLQSNPITVEYPLNEEVVVPYTSAQQEVYNAMKRAISYEEQTNVSSSDIVSPIFTVTAFRDADLAIASLDNQLTLKE